MRRQQRTRSQLWVRRVNPPLSPHRTMIYHVAMKLNKFVMRSRVTIALYAANWLKTVRMAAAAARSKRTPLPDEIAAVLCPAVAMSATCNVYLVCAALKLVILTFKLLQFTDVIIPKQARVGFQYLNVYSNGLIILKSSLHAGVLLIYNKRLRQIILDIVIKWVPENLLRRRDSQEWDSSEDDEGVESEEDGHKQKEAKAAVVEPVASQNEV